MQYILCLFGSFSVNCTNSINTICSILQNENKLKITLDLFGLIQYTQIVLNELIQLILIVHASTIYDSVLY